MDFSYSKTEQLFLQMIRSFAENEVKPLAAEIDEQERFPLETVQKMGRLGITKVSKPGYQPSREDIEAFQMELQAKLASGAY